MSSDLLMTAVAGTFRIPALIGQCKGVAALAAPGYRVCSALAQGVANAVLGGVGYKEQNDGGNKISAWAQFKQNHKKVTSWGSFVANLPAVKQIKEEVEAMGNSNLADDFKSAAGFLVLSGLALEGVNYFFGAPSSLYNNVLSTVSGLKVSGLPPITGHFIPAVKSWLGR